MPSAANKGSSPHQITIKQSVKKESESGGSDSSSSNSYSGSHSSHSSEGDDEEDSEMRDEQQQDAGKVAQSIEVPLSVIQRFFSKKETLTAFL